MSNVDLSRYSKRLIQAIWDPEPRNDQAAHIWCLGVCYASSLLHQSERYPPKVNPTKDGSSTLQADAEPRTSHEISNYHSIEADEIDRGRTAAATTGCWPVAFLDDFEARIWLTYRSSFPAIASSSDVKAAEGMSLQMRIRSQISKTTSFTSDTGWGCMIRSGQCIIVNALAILRFGRDWRRGTLAQEEKQLLSLFADDPRAPFSIHRFVEHGASSCGTFPGQWFGPSATAKCIEALTSAYNVDGEGLRVYVAGDGPDIYRDRLLEIASRDALSFQPILLLVGTRLGIDRVTSVYWETLQNTLRMPQSVGIAGGRPGSSHYFVGTQGNTLIYLDPHHTRTALPYRTSPNDYTQEEVDSCHTRRLRRIALDEMDPSMLFAFLFQSEADFQNWRNSLPETSGKAIFHVADVQPDPCIPGHDQANAVEDIETFDDDNDD